MQRPPAQHERRHDNTVRVAMLCAAALVAQQVGSKATRDAAFLSRFEVTDLPAMMVGAAVLSVLLIVGFSRLMARLGPAYLMPRAFTASAASLLVIWASLFIWPRFASVLLYLQVSAAGALLVSGFWSLANECFDPRQAKREIGRIGVAATFGGLVGGILAERVGAHLPVHWMLPLLALLTGVCVLSTSRLRPLTAAPMRADNEEVTQSVARVFHEAPYLRNLALLVLIVTAGSTLLDYVFKSHAATHFAESAALMRFFAAFYTGAGLLAFVIQTLASRLGVLRLGLANNVAMLPAGLGVGSLVAVLVPGLPMTSLARGVESSLRSSLFRTAYEALFTPVAARDKRVAKTIVDVGCERAGDMVGAGLARLLLLVPVAATNWMLCTAILFALVAFVLARRLQFGYVQELENRLVSGAYRLNLEDIDDPMTRTIVLKSLSLVGDPVTREQVAARIDPSPLRSGDSQRVIRALQEITLTPETVHEVIRLLAWDEVYPHAAQLLARHAEEMAPELTRALLDPESDFAVRRRLPQVLRLTASPESVEGLLGGLRDPRFEVRFRCGRALAALHESRGVPLDPAPVYAAILRETRVDRSIWEGHRLLDQLEEDDPSFEVDYLRSRSNRSLQHVFTLLSLALDKQPLQIAFRGLHTDDPMLRGTALEYLDGTLPPDVRDALWPFLEGSPARERSVRGRREILDALIRSHQSIEINLAQLRDRRRGDP